jgi:hypothetical protein
MRKFTVIVLAIGVIFILQGCATSQKEVPEPDGKLLTQSELEQLHNNRFKYDYKIKKTGRSGTVTSYPDGTQTIDWKTPGNSGTDTGNYKITNGQKCNTWDTLPSSSNKCWKFYKIGEYHFITLATDGESSEVIIK